jgi:hypothetical protein
VYERLEEVEVALALAYEELELVNLARNLGIELEIGELVQMLLEGV